MITRAENYTKNKKTNKKMDRQNPRTNGKRKAIQAKSHKEAYTYTITKREKAKKNYVYIKKKRRKRATKSINKSTRDNKLNTKLR